MHRRPTLARLSIASLLVAGVIFAPLLASAPATQARGVRSPALPEARAWQLPPEGITLNEFLPDPRDVDWNANGSFGDADDEWIELYNANDAPFDLSGWRLDDAEGGSAPYTFPTGTVLSARGYLVVFSVDTHIALNNSGGDNVRLLRPDGTLAEQTSYTTTAPDRSYSKTVDGGADWTMDYPPSPGASNQPPPPPTDTPTPSETPTPTETATATATHTPTTGPTPTPYPAGVSLNEFLPDPRDVDWNANGSFGDADDEWIELYNAGDSPVDLSGWQLDDAEGGSAPYTFPTGTVLGARGYLVVFSADTHIALNNSGGDNVRLLRPDGVEVESHAYTATAPDRSYSKTVDGGADWTMDYPPSPGASNQPATPTATATAAPTATITPTPTAGPTATPYPAGVGLNEFLPDPRDVDWNANGSFGDADDEWIELYNAGDSPVDLSGWQLDDAEGGSAPYTFPTGTVLGARGYLVVFSADTHIALNNSGGDSVRLLRPGGTLAEQTSYTTTAPDRSYSKTVDGGADWTMDYPPSPGASNQPGLWTPTATATATRTRTPTPTATLPPNTGSLAGWVFLDTNANGVFEPWAGETGIANVLVTLSSGQSRLTGITGWYGFHGVTAGQVTVRQAQPIHTHSTTPDEVVVTLSAGGNLEDINFGEAPLPPGQAPSPVELNEFLPSPASDWDGDGLATAEDEWIELVNLTDRPLDLGGWFLDDEAETLDGAQPASPDGSAPYLLPPGTSLPAHGFLVIYRSASRVALNNTGDDVRLLGPGLFQVESYTYGSTGYDVAWSKTVDGGDQWTDAFPPSPHASNQPGPAGTPTPAATASATPTPAGTPTPYPTGIRLNEYLPDPASDWNGDGAADADDEYVELVNVGEAAVDLGGWVLDDLDGGGSRPYVVPPGSWVQPHGFLLLFRSQTGVALNNDGDQVRLLGPDGALIEAASYDSSQDDEAFSKTADGGDEWTSAYPPSPGSTNTPGGTPTPTVIVTATATPTGTPGPVPGGIGLNEFMPDPASDWNGDGAANQNDEYVELFNANDFPVDLGGWRLDDVDDGETHLLSFFEPDGSPPYTIPPGTTIQPQGFLVLFTATTRVTLNNGGDEVRLLHPDGSLAEATAYSTSRNDEAYSKVVDGGGEWTRSFPPSPGSANAPGGTPTPTATATPSGTPGPIASEISLNEFMPDPASDWNGDGQANQDDEYVELFNANAFPVDLGGWRLDDVDDGQAPDRVLVEPAGSPPYTIPPGTVIPPHGFLLFFAALTGVTLNNDADSVRLLRPDGAAADTTSYTASRDDEAYSKLVDGGGDWTRGYPPSPGGTNTPGGTPTPTPTPGPLATAVSLNEFMPRPAGDWNGDGHADSGDEYVELFNAADQPADLGGWVLDDVEASRAAGGTEAPELSRPYTIPPGTNIPARGFRVFFRSQTGVALNDDGDTVRLLRPDGVLVESHDYTSPPRDAAYSKTQDGGAAWTAEYPPSPGQPNRPGFTGDEQVRLNEVLPSPRDVDWDGDGQKSYLDEWVELVNLGPEAVALGGWKLVDGAPGNLSPEATNGRTYVLPRGTVLEPNRYLVIYRRASGLALDAADEQVRLLFPDDTVADSLHYTGFSGYDQPWCRLPDGVGDWTNLCQATPGRANQAGGGTGGDDGDDEEEPPPGPTSRPVFGLVSVAQARTLPDDARVSLEGQVTVLPGAFDTQEIYLQDATGGILVYLRSAQWPALSEGQWVRARGYLDTLDGQREIRLRRAGDLAALQPAPPPMPLPIRTNDAVEVNEGRLVQVSGAVVGFGRNQAFYLDDGSGEVRVVIDRDTAIDRPYLRRGEVWTVTGIVGQNDDEPPYDSGYGLLPRRGTDMRRGAASSRSSAGGAASRSSTWVEPASADMAWNTAPDFLPVTGAASVLSAPSAGAGWPWVAMGIGGVLVGMGRWRRPR